MLRLIPEFPEFLDRGRVESSVTSVKAPHYEVSKSALVIAYYRCGKTVYDTSKCTKWSRNYMQAITGFFLNAFNMRNAGWVNGFSLPPRRGW